MALERSGKKEMNIRGHLPARSRTASCFGMGVVFELGC